MSSSQTSYEIVPFPALQHQMTDWLELQHRGHAMHALLEVDVTETRRAIREYRARTGAPLSLTAFIISRFAHAVDADRVMQAYRLGRRRLVLFTDVDVATMVEREVDGARLPVPHIIRKANQKSLEEIEQEIHMAKDENLATLATRSLSPPLQLLFVHALPVWLVLPAAFRRWVWTVVLHDPFRRKRLLGTVGVTSVGMFGRGAGWSIGPMAHPLTLIVGGITRKETLVGRPAQDREYLCLTLTLDHDLIDGAPAARFAERLKELIEHSAGLRSRDQEPAGAVAPR